MTLTKGLKFIQDNTLNCEVLEIIPQKRIKGKVIKPKITISKNGKPFYYDFECFQKSFNTGLVFGSFKLIT